VPPPLARHRRPCLPGWQPGDFGVAERPLQGGQFAWPEDPLWPISVRPADRPAALHLRLLRHFESVVDLDPKVADCAFQLGVPEQQLDGSKILRATVDQRRLGAAQRVRPVVGAVESELF